RSLDLPLGRRREADDALELPRSHRADYGDLLGGRWSLRAGRVAARAGVRPPSAAPRVLRGRRRFAGWHRCGHTGVGRRRVTMGMDRAWRAAAALVLALRPLAGR